MLKKQRNPLRNAEIKFRKISACKFESNDLNQKQYWRGVIEKVENSATKKAGITLQTAALKTTLPPDLHKRVGNIIGLTNNDPDMFENRQRTDSQGLALPASRSSVEDILKTVIDESRNEPNRLLEEEKQFNNFQLNIEPKSVARKPPPVRINWITDYVNSEEKQRVRWDSKVYKFTKKLVDKPLDEKADELTDLVASDFTEWINSLSTDSSTNLDKNLIKKLFAIGVEGDVSKALYIAPRQMTVLPKDLAKQRGQPELSLDFNIAKLLEEDNFECMKPERKIAFGKCLPKSLKQLKSECDKKVEKVICPEELRTKAYIFQGIENLRSTKAFIKHLSSRSELGRPEYLLERGYFKEQKETRNNRHKPLYAYFEK